MKYQLGKQLCSFESEKHISFSYTIRFMVSEKYITRCTFLYHGAWMHQKSQRDTKKFFSALKLPLRGLVVFIDMNMYILTEKAWSFKTFFKENYAIALDSCYLFTKKMLYMELSMILIVLETLETFLKFTGNLMNTLQFKQMMNLTVC